jgi:hypothetical protein
MIAERMEVDAAQASGGGPRPLGDQDLSGSGDTEMRAATFTVAPNQSPRVWTAGPVCMLTRTAGRW